MHPEYLSTKYAHDLADVRLVAVQHHHAHIASCLAENGAFGPVIGVAFDGLGYGIDGTLWGGEFLVADLEGFDRAGHLEPVPLPGGTAAIRQPWRMALAYLDRLYGDDVPPLDVTRRNAAQWAAVRSVARTAGLVTTSAGRLFDAVAAALDVRDAITYEGQAAIELQHLADASEGGSYRVRILPGPPFQVAAGDLLRACVEDIRAGVARTTIAAPFHNGLADAVIAACRRIRDESGLSTTALSGGVFQNGLLLRRCYAGLSAAGFHVLAHRQVPPNDGGISLGQAAVAAATDRSE
jgi:hydrogenase maturation protein HypF